MPRPATAKLTIASRIVLVLAALGCVAAAMHQASYWLWAFGVRTSIALFIAVAAIVCALIFASARAQPRSVQRIACEVVLFVAGLLTVELVLVAARPITWSSNPVARQVLARERIAEKLRRDFDARTTSEVVQSLRAAGIDAVPGIGRGWARQPEVRKRLAPDFYPLSQASGATVVECNEAGEYLIFQTDEFGFNNPRGLLASRRVDIAAVGESHTLGHCVPAGHGVVDLIRRAHPHTVNFGLGDTRPLSQLATFREYVEPLRPPIVLWIVNPGFAVDKEEGRDPILVRYLNPAFSQGLLHRQHEVDAAVRSLSAPLQATHDVELRAELERARMNRFNRVPKLTLVREHLGPKHKERVAVPDLALFRESLRLAQAAVTGWGGKLFVVVLPGYGHLLGERPEVVRYEAVMQVLREEHLRIIDAASWFLSLKDPARLYTVGSGSHPNPAGHAALARCILEEIDADKRNSAADSKSVRAGVRTSGELFSRALPRK
jgi:hypothetical protein